MVTLPWIGFLEKQSVVHLAYWVDMGVIKGQREFDLGGVYLVLQIVRRGVGLYPKYIL
jgi:hypothetical protein